MSAEKEDNASFRRRRLSVTDSVGAMDLNKGGVGPSTPAAGGGRQRRMSMSPEMGEKKKPEHQLPFTTEMVGTFSCHGIEPGQRQGETHAKINQDRGCVLYPFGPGEKYALFCVYDGHGANGDKASHYTMNTLQVNLDEQLCKGLDPSEAMSLAFTITDDALKKDKTIDAELSGTTAVVVLYEFLEEAGKGKVWVGNAGDSRAVMQKVEGGKVKIVDLSEDQKPNNPDEQRRIEKAGGFVSPPEEEWGGPARVWLDANMTLPGLAMARSIGDHLVKSVGVISKPEVTVFDIDTKTCEQIVMASDGVWEFITSEDAYKILATARGKNAKGTGDATQEVTKLIETAAAKWRQEEGDYRDDITAILINLAKMDKFHRADGA